MSEDVKCWFAQGEREQPTPRIRRALKSDAVAEAWYSAWCLGSSLTHKRRDQHDIARADTELARDVLIRPQPSAALGLGSARGLLTERAAPGGGSLWTMQRLRLDWKPDLLRLGAPAPSALEALSPTPQPLPRLLAPCEIQQVMLRRFVTPENVPDFAWMHCLLRAPFRDADGSESASHLALTQCARRKRALEPLTHAVEMWPLFAKKFTQGDLESNHSLLVAFEREGSLRVKPNHVSQASSSVYPQNRGACGRS